MARRRLRIIVPAFPAFNIYSRIARETTALGPVCVATAVHEIEGWDAEVIDENNLGRYGPRGAARRRRPRACCRSKDRPTWSGFTAA